MENELKVLRNNNNNKSNENFLNSLEKRFKKLFIYLDIKKKGQLSESNILSNSKYKIRNIKKIRIFLKSCVNKSVLTKKIYCFKGIPSNWEELFL